MGTGQDAGAWREDPSELTDAELDQIAAGGATPPGMPSQGQLYQQYALTDALAHLPALNTQAIGAAEKAALAEHDAAGDKWTAAKAEGHATEAAYAQFVSSVTMRNTGATSAALQSMETHARQEAADERGAAHDLRAAETNIRSAATTLEQHADALHQAVAQVEATAKVGVHHQAEQNALTAEKQALASEQHAQADAKLHEQAEQKALADVHIQAEQKALTAAKPHELAEQQALAVEKQHHDTEQQALADEKRHAANEQQASADEKLHLANAAKLQAGLAPLQAAQESSAKAYADSADRARSADHEASNHELQAKLAHDAAARTDGGVQHYQAEVARLSALEQQELAAGHTSAASDVHGQLGTAQAFLRTGQADSQALHAREASELAAAAEAHSRHDQLQREADAAQVTLRHDNQQLLKATNLVNQELHEAAAAHDKAAAAHQMMVDAHQQATTEHQAAAAAHQMANTEHQAAASLHQTADAEHKLGAAAHAVAEAEHLAADKARAHAGMDAQVAAIAHETAAQEHVAAQHDQVIPIDPNSAVGKQLAALRNEEAQERHDAATLRGLAELEEQRARTLDGIAQQDEQTARDAHDANQQLHSGSAHPSTPVAHQAGTIPMQH